MHDRPDREGEQQFRLLGAAWEETARRWQDEVARRFDTDHWTPLARQSRNYLEALAAMMDVLEAAERDTEFLTPPFLTYGGRSAPSRATQATGSTSARRKSSNTVRSVEKVSS